MFPFIPIPIPKLAHEAMSAVWGERNVNLLFCGVSVVNYHKSAVTDINQAESK